MICLKCYWQDFKLTVLSTVWEETYACSLNGVHLIWQSLQKPPNRQNKHTINYYAYTVCLCESISLHLTCYSVVSDLQLLMMAAEELEKLKALYMTFTFISNCSHPVHIVRPIYMPVTYQCSDYKLYAVAVIKLEGEVVLVCQVYFRSAFSVNQNCFTEKVLWLLI